MGRRHASRPGWSQPLHPGRDRFPDRTLPTDCKLVATTDVGADFQGTLQKRVGAEGVVWPALGREGVPLSPPRAAGRGRGEEGALASDEAARSQEGPPRSRRAPGYPARERDDRCGGRVLHPFPGDKTKRDTL